MFTIMIRQPLKMFALACAAVFAFGTMAEAAPKKVLHHRAKHSRARLIVHLAAIAAKKARAQDGGREKRPARRTTIVRRRSRADALDTARGRAHARWRRKANRLSRPGRMDTHPLLFDLGVREPTTRDIANTVRSRRHRRAHRGGAPRRRGALSGSHLPIGAEPRRRACRSTGR